MKQSDYLEYLEIEEELKMLGLRLKDIIGPPDAGSDERDEGFGGVEASTVDKTLESSTHALDFLKKQNITR